MVAAQVKSAPFWVALNICLAAVLLALIVLPYPAIHSGYLVDHGQIEADRKEYHANCDRAKALYITRKANYPEASKHIERAANQGEDASEEAAVWCGLAMEASGVISATGAMRAAWITMIATCVGLIALVGTMLLTWRAVRQTERNSIAQLRPYINVPKITIEFFDNATATIVVDVKNSGQTPAYELGVSLTCSSQGCPEGVFEKIGGGTAASGDTAQVIFDGMAVERNSRISAAGFVEYLDSFNGRGTFRFYMESEGVLVGGHNRLYTVQR